MPNPRRLLPIAMLSLAACQPSVQIVSPDQVNPLERCPGSWEPTGSVPFDQPDAIEARLVGPDPSALGEMALLEVDPTASWSWSRWRLDTATATCDNTESWTATIPASLERGAGDTVDGTLSVFVADRGGELLRHVDYTASSTSGALYDDVVDLATAAGISQPVEAATVHVSLASEPLQMCNPEIQLCAYALGVRTDGRTEIIEHGEAFFGSE